MDMKGVGPHPHHQIMHHKIKWTRPFSHVAAKMGVGMRLVNCGGVVGNDTVIFCSIQEQRDSLGPKLFSLVLYAV